MIFSVIRVDSMRYLVVLNPSVLVVPLQHSVLLPVSHTSVQKDGTVIRMTNICKLFSKLFLFLST